MAMTTLTTIIIANVALDVVLLGLLAYVMSHAGKLEPHRPGVTGNAWQLQRPVRHHHAQAHHTAHERTREERTARRLAAALD
ncbi:MAG: hypothetical protein QOC91_103 [Solirubrobacteraceae bacterium]|jgi:hypothetical protein|nr:hypothetical protein [Solirubrobacteraceae bacterium]